MGWKRERDLLIEQTLAFVQSVTGKTPDAEPNARAELRFEAVPQVAPAPTPAMDVRATEIPAIEITAREILAAESAAPSREINLKLPQTIVSSDIRREMQARVANFRAHQERFHREREEYFSTTLREARAAIGHSAPGLLTPRHPIGDSPSRSSPAPAAGNLKTPAGSRSSESGQGPS